MLEPCAPLPPRRRGLKEALDLVLAEDVESPIDLPPWDNSAMDGYALRAADVSGATPQQRRTVRVVETVPAARVPHDRSRAEKRLAFSQVGRFPRAPTASSARKTLRCCRGRSRLDDRDAGRNIRHRGEDIRKGDRVRGRGDRTRSPRNSACGHDRSRPPLVHRLRGSPPLATGDEIVDLDRAPEILAARRSPPPIPTRSSR